jgi:4-amino-4-deoxy-L-arabinose transferase-like glycosyltransferase
MPTGSLRSRLTKAGFGLFAFVVLSLSILNRPDWKLVDFDQPFYVGIAYDLDRHGVFSNGILGKVDSVDERPQPGMFFGPVFPVLVYAAMQVDPSFAQAVRCAIEADRGHRDGATCEAYLDPVRLIDALLLAIGAVAVGAAAELIFGRRAGLFLPAGLLALAALTAEADIFSFVMTESVIFSLYSLLAWSMLAAWKTGRASAFLLGGLLLGLLCLTKPSFLALFPVITALTILYAVRFAKASKRSALVQVIALSLAFGCVVGAWAVRNAVSVGKLALTEEYGSAALIERFAYDDMTAQEFIQAFPNCVPGLGELAFDHVYGTDSMHRFTFHTAGSFFHVGRDRREALVEAHGRLDPLIGGIIADEMRTNWWRYLLVSIPLAWCGLWAGWIVSLLLVPLFVWACLRALRAHEPLLLLYSAPAVLMLGLHAAVGNHYTRYNLILIGPYAVGAARVMAQAWRDGRWRSQPLAPAP